MFIGISIVVRMRNDLSPLTHSTASTTVSLAASESRVGLSISCISVASLLSVLAGLLWIGVYRKLSKHVKLVEIYDNNGAYAKYNYCCSHW